MAKDKKSDAEKSKKGDKEKKGRKKDKAVKEPVAKAEKKEPKPAKKAAKPKPAPAPQIVITTEEISLRAYFIAERRQAMGWPGDSTSDWVEAERQLKAEAARKARG